MIYSFARSLDVSLFFADRPYKLGETIEVTVELNARRDIKVSKGRVDLVYGVSWAVAATDLQPLRMMHPGPGGRTTTSLTLIVPKHMQAAHRGSYVLGCSSFLKNAQLVPATGDIYNIGIQIHKDDPPYVHFKGASLGWSLVAVVDVARALDVKIRRAVEITVD